MLGDTIAAFLPEFRANALSLMLDTCRIARPGEGEPVLDPDTGKYTDPLPITVYEGPCRIPPRNVTASEADSSGASWTVGEFDLNIPVEHSGYTVGESVATGQTVTYLTAAHDPDLVGRVFGVVEVARGSQLTARRMRVKEAQ